MNRIAEYLARGVEFTQAVVCFLKEDDKVWLGVRKKVSLELGLNVLSGFGGKVGDSPEIINESKDQAVDREVLEEANVKVTQKTCVGRVRFIYTHKPMWNFEVGIYLVTGWEGVPQETAVMLPQKYNIHELPFDQTWKDYPYWVPKVLAGEVVDVVFLYDANQDILETSFY